MCPGRRAGEDAQSKTAFVRSQQDSGVLAAIAVALAGWRGRKASGAVGTRA